MNPFDLQLLKVFYIFKCWLLFAGKSSLFSRSFKKAYQAFPTENWTDLSNTRSSPKTLALAHGPHVAAFINLIEKQVIESSPSLSSLQRGRV